MAKSHFDNRILEQLKKALAKAISKPNEKGPGFVTEGEFYKIFKKYDFYNVADTENSLTEEQRAQVPIHAQYRYSQFANAIAEMIRFILSDENVGILVQINDIVAKLDARSSMNASSVASLSDNLTIAASGGGNPLAANPALAAAGKIQKIKEYLTGFAMGINPYHPDMLPPLNLPSLPDVSLGILGNIQPPAFFVPNWDFLYEYEPVKSSKFYETGSGGLKIGCNIDVSEKKLNLSKIFGVITVTPSTTSIPAINGNLMGGVTTEDIQIINDAAKITDLSIVRIKNKKTLFKSAVYVNNDSAYKKIREFSLNDLQLRCSFYEYINVKLWDVIKNRKNWANGHWGVLTHNSLPDYVKTAICSYVWSNGFAIEPGKSDDAGLISYLTTIGFYYFIGYRHPVRIYGIEGFDVGFDENGKTKDLSGDVVSYGLPRDTVKAKRYWTWVADFLSRFTKNASGDEIGLNIRKRRVAEANLIYKGVGLPEIKFGSNINELDWAKEHTIQGLKERDFDKILNVAYSGASWYRYDNTGSPGGNPDLTPQTPTAKLIFEKQADLNTLNSITNGETVITTIKYLLDQVKATSATITRTATLAESQATTMYNNLNKGDIITYKPAGQAVANVYMAEKEKLGLGSNPKNGKQIPESNRKDVINKMTQEVLRQGPDKVSKHCGDFNITVVIDIGPNSIKFENNYISNIQAKINDAKSKNNANIPESALHAAHGYLIDTFFEAAQPSSGNPKNPKSNVVFDPPLLSRFLFPHKYASIAKQSSPDDPAYHIEITQPATFEVSSNDKLPTIKFQLQNTNFKSSESWMIAFMNDYSKTKYPAD